MPLIRRKRQLAALAETVALGTKVALSATEATFNIFDLVIQPNIDHEEREGQSAFERIAGCPGGTRGTITFSTDVTGGATTPAWAKTFLPACGFVETVDGDGVFLPSSLAPTTTATTSPNTLTMGVYEDGLYKYLRGAMGNAVLHFPAGKRVMIDWTFTGIWDAPTDVGLLTPTYSVVAPIRMVAAATTIGSWAPVFSEMTIDLGNVVAQREDADDASGYGYSVITDRNITGTMDCETGLVASDNDAYAHWAARTEAALSIDLGDTDNALDVTAPALQVTNVQEGDRNGIQIDTVSFQLNRSAALGSDSLSIDISG